MAASPLRETKAVTLLPILCQKEGNRLIGESEPPRHLQRVLPIPDFGYRLSHGPQALAGVTKSAPSTNPAVNGVVPVRGDDGFVAAATGEGRRARRPDIDATFGATGRTDVFSVRLVLSCTTRSRSGEVEVLLPYVEPLSLLS